MSQVILKARGLVKSYPAPSTSWWSEKKQVRALQGVDLDVREAETVAIVGESGCGKSTLARVLMRLEEPSEGSLSLNGLDAKSVGIRDWQRSVQMIFQDPLSSLNPRRTVLQSIAEPLEIEGRHAASSIREMVFEKMDQVGLRRDLASRYPHMLSGGQRQRVGIARALTLSPRVLICDEPVSALDVSIQAQVLNLLLELQQKFGLSLVFVSHDLGVVRHIAHRIAVMYLGRFVEVGPRDQVALEPQHPYTQALQRSTPSLDRFDVEIEVLAGELPSPLTEFQGCAFQGRCPKRIDICATVRPEPSPRKRPGRDQTVIVACHLDPSNQTMAAHGVAKDSDPALPSDI
jgi:oligopeptide/dipeptide ABC transporter ATP-binding protein